MKSAPQYFPKDVSKLTDKQLAERLFPKTALDKIKAEQAELEKKPARKASDK